MSGEDAERVIDFHTRLSRRANSDRLLLKAMDAAGIARAVVTAGGLLSLERLSEQIQYGGRAEVTADNRWILNACAASHGRLVPFFLADPAKDQPAYAADATAFRGLEISPAVHGYRLDDPAVYELMSTAQAHDHPVYIACLGRPGASAGDLVALAARYPGTTFVFGHCGHTALDVHGLARVAGSANIVAEVSGCFLATTREALVRLGPRRVLFGSAYPLQDLCIELMKIGALDLTRGDRRLVLSGNADRLLGVAA